MIWLLLVLTLQAGPDRIESEGWLPATECIAARDAINRGESNTVELNNGQVATALYASCEFHILPEQPTGLCEADEAQS